MKDENVKLLALLLGGAAVGATLAVLFAPTKGSELRTKIVDEAGGLKNVLSSKLNEVGGIVDRLTEMYNHYSRAATK